MPALWAAADRCTHGTIKSIFMASEPPVEPIDCLHQQCFPRSESEMSFFHRSSSPAIGVAVALAAVLVALFA
jgi:hypothetical protein